VSGRSFLTSAAVAQALGLVSAEAFLARRATLEAAPLLFPPPMPHCKRPLLWRADEVDGWISRHGIPATAGIDPALIATGKVALLDMARTA
jgi:hypothetical protein